MSENFIMEVPKAFSKKFCVRLINRFEKNSQQHTKGIISKAATGEKSVDLTAKDDTEIQFDPSFMNTDWADDLEIIMRQVDANLRKYVERYSFIDEHTQKDCGLKGIADLALEGGFNMQRFDPGKGFFTWHTETSSDNNSFRQIVWMIYLNDIKEKGGTLFKYQDLRVAPEVGKMLIWPAGWTHFHKSEVAPKETKYIITGWYQYKPEQTPPPQPPIMMG